MEYEYDGLEEYGGRVLWGRIAFFAVALLLLFFLGRCTASGGVPQSEVDELEQKVADLTEQNTRLNDQLAAAQANAKNALGTTEDTSESVTDSTSESASESPRTRTMESEPGTRPRSSAISPGSKTYTVKQGDYLNKIAEEVYGRATSARVNAIAKANNLRAGQPLVVGQKLIIPPDPEQQ
jgi:nucleoid-associated protein YgaU